MNILEILGCVGGTLYLINYLIRIYYVIADVVCKYKKYKDAYELNDNDSKEKTIGFKPIEKVKYNKDYFEKLKDVDMKIPKDEGYFDMYWESEPVDDEFIEEEEFEEEGEDWEDKYPDLHVER